MTQPYLPAGTVYGTLLNFRSEVDAMAAQMTQPPYKAPPQAPVLHIKPANTWSASGANVPVPSRVPEVEVGATLSLVIGPGVPVDRTSSAMNLVANVVLMNDLSVPHASYFRPPVKFKCLDGFLGIGAQAVPLQAAGDLAHAVLDVRINGELRQTVRFAGLMRDAARLLADVGEFMTLRPGDVLMLGCDILPTGGRPLARVGDRIEISAPGIPALGTLTNTLVAEAA